MVEELSKILIFGGTGYIGKNLVKASISPGHKTYAYSRSITLHSLPSKIAIHNEFQSMDVTIIQQGNLDEHEKIVAALRQVDVVISALAYPQVLDRLKIIDAIKVAGNVKGNLDEHEKIVAALRKVDVVISALAYPQVLDQLKIIDAIKVAGNVKRFFPSDFGVEEDRVSPLPPFNEFLEKKRKIRRAIEEAGIPYTYVSSNCCGAYFVNFLLRPHDQSRDVVVYGTGEVKAVLNYEKDIGMYTIKLADDPRACNRVVIYRPQGNIISQLELISLWEEKTGQSFNKVHVSEEDIIKLSQNLPHPENIPVAILHSVFVKGELMNFDVGEDYLEASSLYPDYQYTNINQLLDIFLVDPPLPATASFE